MQESGARAEGHYMGHWNSHCSCLQYNAPSCQQLNVSPLMRHQQDQRLAAVAHAGCAAHAMNIPSTPRGRIGGSDRHSKNVCASIHQLLLRQESV